MSEATIASKYIISLLTLETGSQLVAKIQFLFHLALVIELIGWAARMVDNSWHYQHGVAKGDVEMSSPAQSASL